MSTGLHWLASSERERRQALELARALQQRESLDELGIGSVRDALSDRLFPGTSTLHTRARYHLFIPWAYEQAVTRGGSGSLAPRVRATEVELIAALKRHHGDTRGLIGRDAGAKLQNMPSTVYWQGLHVWGIRLRGGPQGAIERALRSVRGTQAVRDDDGEPLDAADGGVWHANLPEAPPDHPREARFELTFDEAEFLAERLRTQPRVKDTTLAELVSIQADHEAVGSIWQHPDLGALSTANTEVIEQARRFSLLMHGAAWLYNVVLADLLVAADRPDNSELLDAHRDSFATWAADVTADHDRLVDWPLDDLWRTARRNIPLQTRRFVADWQSLIRQHGAEALVDHEDARLTIIRREQTMKRQNARTLNKKALNQWSGRSGVTALDFRWPTARLLVSDIRHGLERADAAH